MIKKQIEGSNLLQIITDLKHTAFSFADQLGIQRDVVLQWIKGDEEIPYDMKMKIASSFAVPLKDLYLTEDDTDNGVIIVKEEETKKTEHVLERKGKPYYAIRDMAVSRLAPHLAPEWMEILHKVEDNSSENPTVAWNQGHLQYQFTYFIGPVNFYYEINHKKYCAPMNTGDTMFLMPAIPHSFAKRNNEKGIILAINFHNTLRREVIQELSLLGIDNIKKYIAFE